MDHNEALQQMAAERYLLQELTPDAREAFEEHLFDCPEHGLPWVGLAGADAGAPHSWGSDRVYPRSYNINQVSPPGPGESSQGFEQKNYRISTIPKPGTTIFLAEAYQPNNVGQTCYWNSNVWSPNNVATWHNGKCNFLFVDGHVELMSPSESALPGTIWSQAGSAWCVFK